MLLTKFFLHFFTYLIEVIFFQCNTDLLPRIIFSVLSFDTPLQTAVFVARVSAPIGFSAMCVAAVSRRCRQLLSLVCLRPLASVLCVTLQCRFRAASDSAVNVAACVAPIDYSGKHVGAIYPESVSRRQKPLA